MWRKIASGVAITSVMMTLTAGPLGASSFVKKAAKRYLADVTPVNLALGRFATDASHWGSSTTQSIVTKQTEPAIAALRKLQNELIVQTWPRKSRSDVRKLIAGISPLVRISCHYSPSRLSRGFR